jgi:hypothetical protein
MRERELVKHTACGIAKRQTRTRVIAMQSVAISEGAPAWPALDDQDQGWRSGR